MLLTSSVEVHVERSFVEMLDDLIALDGLPYDDLRSSTRDLADRDDDDDADDSKHSGVCFALLSALRQALLSLLRRRPR